MTSPFVAPDLNAPRLSHIVGSPIGRLLCCSAMGTPDRAVDAGRRPALVAGRGGIDAGPGNVRRGRRAAPEAYFAGDLKEFTVPLAPTGTPFRLAVWIELTKIPYGSTVSYGDIARALGKRLVASRAVGLANGANPISVIVPCHRVISSDGGLTGYGGGLRAPGAAAPDGGSGPGHAVRDALGSDGADRVSVGE